MRRILVVDDRLDMQNLLTEILRRVGYDVGCAENGEDALLLLEKRPFDLIITDLSMPKMDGQMLLKAVKRSRPSLPVVVITGFGSPDTAAEMGRLGADGYLPKPFRIGEVEGLVKELLEM